MTALTPSIPHRLELEDLFDVNYDVYHYTLRIDILHSNYYMNI
jgi:hypothetical protein